MDSFRLSETMVSGSWKLTFHLLTVYLVIRVAKPSARCRHFSELKYVFFAFFLKTTRRNCAKFSQDLENTCSLQSALKSTALDRVH